MKRAVALSAASVLILLAVLLHTPVKNFLWVHPWFLSVIVALPTIVLGTLDTLHRRKANTLGGEANELQREIAKLTAELNAERNKQLQRIARNTERPLTRGERTAEVLRRHLGETAAVTEEGSGTWPGTPVVAQVGEDQIVTLFTPRGQSSSSAHAIQAHCEDLEAVEVSQGACALRLKVLKRYGPVIQLGEITKWEERSQPAATPTFAKGGVAYHATYSKPGSSETRTIYVYTARDGSNSFLLEASAGHTVIGNNEEISKRFMVFQVEYEAAGFKHSASGSGGSPHQLFIHV